MNEICLRFDQKAQRELEALKKFYKLPDYAATIKRGLTLLMTAKEIEEDQGKLIAEKDNKKVVINVS